MNHKKIIASVCAISMALTAMPLRMPASLLTEAASQTYQDQSKSAVISIGQAYVTKAELEAANYCVPVLIKIPHNPGINQLEFGVQSELGFEIYSSLDELETDNIASLRTASPEISDIDELYFSFSSQVKMDQENFAWISAASARPCKTESFAVLLMHVPHDAEPGSVYPIEFCNTSISSQPAVCIRQDIDSGQKTDYIDSGDFKGLSGSVSIINEGDAIPTEEVPSEGSIFSLQLSNISVTPKQLKQADYTVPILITAEKNPGITSLEFGVSSDLDFIVLPDINAIQNACLLDTAPPELASIKKYLDPYYFSVNENHYAWFTWGGSTPHTDQVIAVLLANVPRDVQPGDSYTFDIADSLTGSPTICILNPDGGKKIDYVESNLFESFSGTITILADEEDPTEDITEPTEPTEPTKPAEPTEPAESPAEFLGDVNNDGMVNAKDATVILRYSAASAVLPDKEAFQEVDTVFSEEAFYRCSDINRDGFVDAFDAMAVLNYAAAMGVGMTYPFETIAPPQAGGKLQIGQQDVYITESDLKNYNYRAYFNLPINGLDKNFTSVEFGLSSDLNFEFIRDYRYDDDGFITGIPKYVNTRSLVNATSTSAQNDGKTVSWTSFTNYRSMTNANFLLSADLPQSCKAGDIFTIDFMKQSPMQINGNHKTAFLAFTDESTSVNYKARLTGEGIRIHVISDADGSSYIERRDNEYSTKDDTPEPSAIIAGDVDDSGTADILDVIAVNKFILGVKQLNAAQQKAADVNKDNAVDAADSLLILKFALDMITSFDTV